MEYDNTNPKSIEAYARRLIGKSLAEVLKTDLPEYNHAGRGRLGNLLEKHYFGYEPNANSEPDFPLAGVELKNTPLKKIKRGLVSKERLVLNIINYLEEHKYTFATSSFWRKNSLLLLLFYIDDGESDVEDLKFSLARLWRFPPEDLKIIKDDWTKIVGKILDGRAHEISEGDTLYLGACTKGKDKSSLRHQPFSPTKAMQRAFSIKSKYINYIIGQSQNGESSPVEPYADYDLILADEVALPKAKTKAVGLFDAEPAVKGLEEYEGNETFEDLIERKFMPFYGRTETDLFSVFQLNANSKQKFSDLARKILGVKTRKIAEFEKAGIVMKTIRRQFSGSIKEAMSFEQIKFTEIVNEDWDTSVWHEIVTKRFLFVILRETSKGSKEFQLERVMFWTMPVADLEVAREFWEDTQGKIMNGVYDDFIKISDDRICHVRPKGEDGKDLMPTPQNTLEKKKCYWLNSSYIREQLDAPENN